MYLLETSEKLFHSHSERSEEFLFNTNLRYFALLNMTNTNYSEVSFSNIESVELVTDLKNIGDRVEIEINFVIKIERAEVNLIKFYSDWYLVEISFVSLLFFINAIFETKKMIVIK